jgi:RNA polymerase sigma-70 factor (ECF subfamily)
MSIEEFKQDILPQKNKLYRFAYRLVADEEEAKDIVQETMIRAWKNQAVLDEVDNKEAWCMRVTKNMALDKLKSKRHQTTDGFKEGFDVQDQKEAHPGKLTELKDMMTTIKNFIKQLPEKQQQVVQLRDIEGLSYKEIGDALGIDLNQVKVNLFRARKSLKENIINVNAYGL